MAKNEKNINKEPQLNRELEKRFSGSKVTWNKSKEDIWTDMMDKIQKKKLPSKAKVIRLNMLKYAAVAIITLLISFSGTAYFYAKDYKTELAQEIEILLPDNSKVKLHAQSTLSYKPLLWNFSRTIRLEGKGFFDVEKGKRFKVLSENGSTVVLGTKFEIDARNNNYDVACSEGKVKVSTPNEREKAIITRGEKAILDDNGKFKIIKQLKTKKAEVKQKENEHDIIKKESINSTKNKKINAEAPTIRENKKKRILNSPEKLGTKPEIIEKPTVIYDKTDLIQKQLKQVEKKKIKNVEITKTDKQHKDKFRASLKAEQVQILNDEGLNKKERTKAFMQSLSDEQRELLKNQKKEIQRKNTDIQPKASTVREDERKEKPDITPIKDQIKESNKELQKRKASENRENIKLKLQNKGAKQ